MAVSILSVVQVDSDQASSSTSVTVPSGAELALLCGGYWAGGGVSLTSASLGGSSMTEIEDWSNGSHQNGAVAYLVSPPSGSQTFAWTISAAPGDGATYLLIFLDGTDTTTPIRDSISVGSGSASFSTASFTTVSGDYVLAFHSGYNLVADITAGSQTEEFQSSIYRNQRNAIGSKTASGTTTTVSVAGADSGTSLFGVAIVPAAGGTPAIAGVASITEADDSLSAAGTVALAGTASITEADDSLSAAGTVALVGALSATESDDAVSAIGALSIVGVLSMTEADDSLDATGAFDAGITGSAAITEADDTLSAAGAVALAGTASITEADDTLSSASVLALTAQAAISDADDTLLAAGTLPIVAIAIIIEASDGLAATGAVAIVGVLSVTEANDTVIASSGQDVQWETARLPEEWTSAVLVERPPTAALEEELYVQHV